MLVQLPVESDKHQRWCNPWGGDMDDSKPGSRCSGLDQLTPSWNRTPGGATQSRLFKLLVMIQFFPPGPSAWVLLKSASSSDQKGWAASPCYQQPFPQTHLHTCVIPEAHREFLHSCGRTGTDEQSSVLKIRRSPGQGQSQPPRSPPARAFWAAAMNHQDPRLMLQITWMYRCKCTRKDGRDTPKSLWIINWYNVFFLFFSLSEVYNF